MNTTLVEYKEYLQEIEQAVSETLEMNKSSYSKDLMYALDDDFQNMFRKGIKVDSLEVLDIIVKNYNYGTLRFKSIVSEKTHDGLDTLTKRGETQEDFIRIIAENDAELRILFNKMATNNSFYDVASRTTDDIFTEIKRDNRDNEYFLNNSFELKRAVKVIIEKKFNISLDKSQEEIIYKAGLRFSNFKDDVVRSFKEQNRIKEENGETNSKRLSLTIPGISTSEEEKLIFPGFENKPEVKPVSNQSVGLPTDIFKF